MSYAVYKERLDLKYAKNRMQNIIYIYIIYSKNFISASTREAEMQAAVEVASLSVCASNRRCLVAPWLQRQIAKAPDNFSNISQFLYG